MSRSSIRALRPSVKSRLDHQNSRSKLGICMLSLMVTIALLGMSAGDKIRSEISFFSSSSNISLQVHTVSQGDTLWTIASNIVTDKEDIREKVIHIRTLNGMTASQNLIPGQIIQVPVTSDRSDFMFANSRK